MKRTPQPTFTQSKLTSMLQPTAAVTSAGPAPAAAPEAAGTKRTMTIEQVEMDTSPTAVGKAPLVTEDFLLRTMRENTEQILKSFSAHLGALSQRVDGNAAQIADNRANIAKHEEEMSGQRVELAALASRVDVLEKGHGQSRTLRTEQRRAPLSQAYLLARWSVRLWPVTGGDEEALWEGAGDFIHDVQRVSQVDVCQEDIEVVARVLDHSASVGRDEVLVTFVNSRKRDLVVSHSTNLADRIDTEGRPTAGVRLEVPGELSDTFRLLSRFGTRLRARHGAGTKRH